MSLATRITELTIRVATELKSIRTLLNGNAPDLSGLSTTAKSNLVAAINELYGALATAAGIDDSTTSTSTTWSSSKTHSEITAAETRAVDAAVDDSTSSSTTSAWSSSYTSSRIAAAVAALIDDTAAADDHVYSSEHTEQRIAAAIAELVDSAPGDLDTLRELAQRLQDESSAIAAINTALGNRVRVDAAQSFTSQQQAQGRNNIGAVAAADVGDTNTNFVASLEAALV